MIKDIQDKVSQQKAFAKIMLKHKKELQSYCVRKNLSHPEENADIIQETLSVAWGRRSELFACADDNEQVFFLLNVAHRIISLHHRKFRPRFLPIELFHHKPDLDTGEYKETIEEMMVVLGDDEKKLINMKLDGLSNNEIAEQCGIKEIALRKRLSRIYRKMRDYYNSL